MSVPETDLGKLGETVFTEAATGTGVPSLPAVDGRQIVGRINVSASDPTAGNDNTQGYAPGLRWVNTTAPVKSYVCVDASTGAAIWIREGNIKINVGAALTPTITNDDSEEYEIGSVWITTDNLAFIATSVATGAARWAPANADGGGGGAGSATPPGELMFGTLLDYPSPGNVSSGTVFYLRLKVSAGVVISDMRTFIDSGGTVARELRMGLYAQTDPADPYGVPVTRVAQTANDDTAGDSGLFKTLPLLGGNYTIAVTGFYWLAVVSDSTSLKFAVTAAARADFLPVRQESGTGTTLPATTGTLTNPISAVLYVAAVEA